MSISNTAEGCASVASQEAEAPRHAEWRWAGAIFAVAALGIWLLHPRIGINDVDAHGYILGAKSLNAGTGYRDLNGLPLNHWPPGYSFILSLTPNPIIGAQVINYLCFGGAVAMLFLLATHVGWPRTLATALAAGFGFGFLRILAMMAKPDILTFFVFLSGAWLYGRVAAPSATTTGRGQRLLACLLLSSLIPFKLVAVVFAPGVLLADWWVSGNRNFWLRLPQHVLAAIIWLVFAAGTVTFNYLTIHQWSASSYLPPTLPGIVHELKRFADAFFFGFLALWYGALREPEALALFGLTLGTGVGAVLSLGPTAEGRPMRCMGIGVFVLSWLLMAVRLYHADLRLMGYGVLLILISFIPRGRLVRLWICYGAASAALAVFSAMTTVSTGTNHPAYEQVARRVAVVGLPDAPIVSNSFHILDVHAGIPTRLADSLEKLPRGTVYVEITLPIYDARAKTIWPLSPVDDSWAEIASVEGARVYRKVKGEGGELPPVGLRVIH